MGILLPAVQLTDRYWCRIHAILLSAKLRFRLFPGRKLLLSCQYFPLEQDKRGGHKQPHDECGCEKGFHWVYLRLVQGPLNSITELNEPVNALWTKLTVPGLSLFAQKHICKTRFADRSAATSVLMEGT